MELQSAFNSGYELTTPKNPLVKNPHLWSSNMWEAFELGRFIKNCRWGGRSIFKSKGSSYKDRTGQSFTYDYKLKIWVIE